MYRKPIKNVGDMDANFLNDYAQRVQSSLPKGVGFAIVIFDQDVEKPEVRFISSATEKDTIRVLNRTVVKLQDMTKENDTLNNKNSKEDEKENGI